MFLHLPSVVLLLLMVKEVVLPVIEGSQASGAIFKVAGASVRIRMSPAVAILGPSVPNNNSGVCARLVTTWWPR